MPPQPSRRSLETISVTALFVTLAAAVFFIIPSSAVPFVTTKAFVLAAGSLVTLALYIFARLSRGNIVFPPMVLVGVLWLPVVAYILSAAFSGVSFTNAFWGSTLEADTLGFVLVATLLGTLVALMLRRPEQYRMFLCGSAWVFGTVTLLGVLGVAVGQFAPDTISPAFSVVGSFTNLAFVLGLGVVGMLITFRFVELSLRTRRLLLASSVGALALLALANASLVWTLVALVALGFFVEAVMRRGSKSIDADLDDSALIDEEVSLTTDEGNHSLVLPLVVLVVSLFFLIGGTLGGALATALKINVLNVRPSLSSTLAVGQKTYATSPAFGSGPNTFSTAWLKHRDTSLNSTVFWNVNFSSGIGFIPTSAVTTGLVGALAWIVFLLFFIALGLRMLVRRAPQDAFIRYVAILSFVASLYLFALAIFDLPNTVVLALAFVFAGLFASTMRYAAGGKQWGIIFSRSPRLGFVIVFSLTLLLLASVVAAYALVGRYIATTNLAHAQAAYASGDFDAAEQAAERSVSFAQSADAYQLEAGIALARLGEIAASSTIDKTTAQKEYQTALSAGINAAITATNLDPANVQNWLALGNLYAQAVPLKVSGAYDSAKTAYDKAKALDPANPQILFILAQLDIAHEDTKAAEENLKAAIALKQDYTDAIFLLSQLEVQDGNVKDALTSALAAAYFSPNNPNILFQVGILSAAQGDLATAEQALAAAIVANPQFANAHYFLSAVYAKQGNMKDALTEMQAIANLSVENAEAVASQLTALTAGTNPFPANLLAAPSTPVKQ